MKWNENLTVGNQKIDNQHKKLIETLNKHLEACTNRKGKEEIISTLNFLAEYVVIHFKDEEKYLADNSYPEFAQHKAIHSKFTNEVSEIIASVKIDGVSLPIIIDVNKKLSDWVYNHIMKEDKKYYKYFSNS